MGWGNYDAWLEGPATDGSNDACDFCEDDEGCHRCNKEMAADHAAELAMDRREDCKQPPESWQPRSTKPSVLALFAWGPTNHWS